MARRFENVGQCAPLSVMAGLDPATQLAHVRAREKLTVVGVNLRLALSLSAAQTRGRWVAGSRPAMTPLGWLR